MRSGRRDAAELIEKRPRLIEVLDDVAANDPVESFVDDGDDLANVAAIHGIDPLFRDGGGRGIELDADDAALLPPFEGLAQRRLAAAKLEDRLRVRADAIE